MDLVNAPPPPPVAQTLQGQHLRGAVMLSKSFTSNKTLIVTIEVVYFKTLHIFKCKLAGFRVPLLYIFFGGGEGRSNGGMILSNLSIAM